MSAICDPTSVGNHFAEHFLDRLRFPAATAFTSGWIISKCATSLGLIPDGSTVLKWHGTQGRCFV